MTQREQIKTLNPEALFLDNKYDAAIVASTYDDKPVYKMDRLISIISKDENCKDVMASIRATYLADKHSPHIIFIN